MTDKQVKLVKEALGSSEVCSMWKEKIRETFPEIIQRDINCWYKIITYGDKPIFVYVTEWIDAENMKGVGFTVDGKFNNSSSEWGTGKKCEKAGDTKDFKTFLLLQATARGMTEGVLAENNIFDGTFTIGTKWDLEVGSPHNTTLWVDASDHAGRFSIFKNGKWSTPVKTITKHEAERILKMKIID